MDVPARNRRFSPIKDIDTTTVNRLSVDWYLDLPNDAVLVSTPLVVNGILYFTGTMNRVRAVDATNGKMVWEFDPEVGKLRERPKARLDPDERTFLLQGKDFFGTLGRPSYCTGCENWLPDWVNINDRTW